METTVSTNRPAASPTRPALPITKGCDVARPAPDRRARQARIQHTGTRRDAPDISHHLDRASLRRDRQDRPYGRG
jgi:hypothetical protein